MVPISSKTDKYQKIYDYKVQKRGFYDGIRFGYVNGQKRAFLLQNIFPVTAEYIDEPYMIERGTVFVRVNESFASELNGLARKIIRLHKRGVRITMTDLDSILSFLEK